METQMGIVTRGGDWFHTTREHIQAYAPGLLDKVPLEALVKEAEAWVKSADSLGLMLLYGLLFLVNPWLAAGITLLFHWGWYHYKSALVVRGAGALFRFLNSDAFLFLVAFISLSALGFQQQYVAVGIGVVFFFILKPGLLRRGWRRLSGSSNQGLTPNDRVLKMVIVKRSFYADAAPADVEAMEERLRQVALNRRTGKNE